MAVVAVTVLLLTACSGLFDRPGYTDSTADGGITIASLRPKQTAELKPYYAQKARWTTCHDDLECASVRVPVDWQHVTTSSISLALVKHPASGTSRGDLVVNPGGPGGSGRRPHRWGLRADLQRRRGHLG